MLGSSSQCVTCDTSIAARFITLCAAAAGLVLAGTVALGKSKPFGRTPTVALAQVRSSAMMDAAAAREGWDRACVGKPITRGVRSAADALEFSFRPIDHLLRRVTGHIRHIRAHAGIWFATHADVARYVKQQG